MAVDALNKVSYVDQEFSTAVTQIQNFLATNYADEFNDYIATNIGQALIDIIAYSEQSLMWYMNRRVTDLYFPTAVTPNSISKIARMLGYKSKGATSAQVNINITLPKGPYTFPVTINPGFQFKGPNNTIWEYRNTVPVVFAPGSVSGTLQVDQGYTVINNFVSNGQNNQFFKLLSVPTGKYVKFDSLMIKVDGVEWLEEDVIPFSGTDNYESNLVAFPPFVKFGDGVQGNVPPTGSGIEVTYVVTDGFRGRITSGGIKDPVNALIAQFQTIPLVITQPLASVGGDDPEDIRSITVNAPLFQRTQDRAITKSDYDFLSNQFANVARADAIILRGVSGDVTIQSIYSYFRQQIGLLQNVSGCTVSGGDYVSSTAIGVSGYLDVLYDYLDETISDSCRANTVQVSVLGKDSGRKYVDPLSSTLTQLKAHLDERKDVTHYVVTVSGMSKVVEANITIEVRADKNANEDDVVQGISDALIKSDVAPLGILIERDYNKSLYVWEINNAIRDTVVDADAHIDFLNIKINGPTQYLDSGGNLVIPNGFVIQHGTLTITRIARF